MKTKFSERHEVASIKIIDMLPDAEMGTARRLDEQLQTLAASTAGGLPAERLKVRTKAEFDVVMQRIVEACEAGLDVPILHFEAHGSPIGLEYPNGERLLWNDLAMNLTKINRASAHNLIVVMSTCYGSMLSSALSILRPAPFAILVAPSEPVSVGAIELPTERFYSDLLRQLQITDAFDRHLKQHRYISALGFFCRYWLSAYKLIGTAGGRERFREETLTYTLKRVPAANKKHARKAIKHHTPMVFQEQFELNQALFFHGAQPMTVADLKAMLNG
ncbi:hypothetical protein [Stutzerimonas nitrititolerans]|uniref:hypothetical protein n=1 Tax=Stutzerimonas nitrititolerans TaxID=2482751 RepID=UPI001BD6D928|nr:hypothetical protein [Stutzerimonas nitrititolerans]